MAWMICNGWMPPGACAGTALHAHAALSPSTGIIDSHALLQALLADAEAHGAQLACHSPLSRGRVVADGMELEIAGITIQARLVINAAGRGHPLSPPAWLVFHVKPSRQPTTPVACISA
jgi:glycine/D-amino acid oxidase-like deaminating enzyme